MDNNEVQRIDVNEKDLKIECSLTLESDQWSTDYFDCALSKKGAPALVYHNNAVFLFMPKSCAAHQSFVEHGSEMACMTAGIMQLDGSKEGINIQVDAINKKSEVLSVNIPDSTIMDLPYTLYLKGVFRLVVICEGEKNQVMECCFQYTVSLPHRRGVFSETKRHLMEIAKIRFKEGFDAEVKEKRKNKSTH